MYLKEYNIVRRYERLSKCGKPHEYWRSSSICMFRCDNCNKEFERPRGKMDPKRLNNNYFHVCGDCDAKTFAQKRGVDRKKIWDMPVDSGLDISKI